MSLVIGLAKQVGRSLSLFINVEITAFTDHSGKNSHLSNRVIPPSHLSMMRNSQADWKSFLCEHFSPITGTSRVKNREYLEGYVGDVSMFGAVVASQFPVDSEKTEGQKSKRTIVQCPSR